MIAVAVLSGLATIGFFVHTSPRRRLRAAQRRATAAQKQALLQTLTAPAVTAPSGTGAGASAAVPPESAATPVISSDSVTRVSTPRRGAD